MAFINEIEVNGVMAGVEVAETRAIVIFQAGLTITKTADPSTWTGEEGPLTFTIEIVNNEAEPFEDVVITDVLSEFADRAVFVDGTLQLLKNGVEYPEASATYDTETNTVTATIPVIEMGETVTITFQLQVPTP